MAKPLVSEVLIAARTLAGDPTGQALTFNALQPFYQVAYSELFRAYQAAQNERIRQETYYNLPAYTSVLDPTTAGVTNLGELESIEERGGVATATVLTATPNSPSTAILNLVTTSTNQFATGQQIVLYGMTGLTDIANGLFTVRVITGTNFYANGCTATGTYTSGGVASYSAEEFYELIPQQRILYIDTSPQTILRTYAWEGDVIRFPACSADRQLRITYSLSGDAPTSTTAVIQIDDSKDFLSFRICGLALQARGNRDKAALFNGMAVGPDWQKGIMGGMLEQLLASGVRNLQRLPPSQRCPPPFRARRRYMVW